MDSVKRTPRPWTYEPNCIHPGGEHQPASWCDVCQYGPELAQWGAAWDAWLRENPNSHEARIVAQIDARRAGEART